MDAHTICLLLLAFFVALSISKDLREDCSTSDFGINTLMCTFEEGSIYKLLKADALIERVHFDRLPTGLDAENLPNLETLGIKFKMIYSKTACQHIQKK